MIDMHKVIDIIDPQAGIIRETDLTPQPLQAGGNEFEGMMRSKLALLQLLESTTTSQFAMLMRSPLKAILFSSYLGIPNTHEQWMRTEPSNNPDETWLEGSTLGLLPKVAQGAPYPKVDLSLDRSVKITNDKRGAIISVTREMLLFDKLGMVRQQLNDLGAAMAMTEETDAYTIISTTGNFTRTTADNDIGNNTNTTTFSPAGLELAFSTLMTMKDRKSGRYLGVIPNTLIVGPRLMWGAKQLLLSPQVDGVGDSNAAITYGQGTTNPFRGVIDRIVVSPVFGSSYQWCLMQRNQPVVKQVVWDLELSSQTDPNNSSSAMTHDEYLYRASKMYGVGMLNDRFAYYSDSTTSPAVD